MTVETENWSVEITTFVKVKVWKIKYGGKSKVYFHKIVILNMKWCNIVWK